MGESNPFESLPQNAANYAALSPVSFLAWAGEVYPEHTALIHGELRQSWGETYARASTAPTAKCGST